ncbi:MULTISPECIES: HD domain-containing protein [unclassified Lebetimonas]|uniref:[protein-PII] uridylyltransferase family protein n=2 Tax=Lebetimonas TaxID=267989 RepID=UPI0004642E43|nr:MULTISPECIES: HD domain-containing protein [unclassified Lebetimonas]
MQLEELIYSSNDDFEISKILKKEIKNYLQNIKIEGGKDFFVKHTKKMDYYISLIYKYLMKKTFDDYSPPVNSIPITVIALGSYGREQLSIYSDIDIMIVYKNIKGYNINSIIENFIIMLWDLGLKIGHRVHEIKDLFPASNEDITIKTAMLESRFITGSKFLWVETQNELNKIRNYNKKDYILAKYEEMLERHKKYPVTMEPNIKDGFGGIRDSNTLLWITKVLFNYPNTSYLIPKYINENDFKEYRSSLEFLFKTRVYLHLTARKKTDNVILEYQREIALNLGYTDSPRLKAERKFIKDLLKALWKINLITNITIKRLIKPYLYKYPVSKIKETRIKKNFYLCEETLYTRFNVKIKFNDLIKTLIDTDFKKWDISLISLLKETKFQKINVKKLFYKENLYPLFFALYKAEKLRKLFPPFEKVKFLAQFDGYHHYPVDIHSLYTLKEIECLDEFKRLSNKDKAILRFSAFFHDLGKGRSGDHCIIGAKIAKNFAQNLGFESDTVFKLVKYHTLMSNVAQREDIYNDKVILSFAQTMENERFLKLLYILTIADIKAVGKDVYTPFKASLLKSLYENTLTALKHKELINEIAIRKRKENILKNKEEFKKLPKSFQIQLLTSPSNQLFLQNGINEILLTALWLKDTQNFKYKIENKTHLTIHLAKEDKLNFSIGWFLEKIKLPLNHLSIYKIGEIKYFKIEFNDNVEDFDIPLIENYIKKAFEENQQIKTKVKFKKREIKIDCFHSPNYASMKIKTEDKKGIVSTILQVLDDFKIRVEDVKISTQKNIARDLFIISKENGFCEKKENILKALT